jgi:hypothetical protein
MKKKLKSDSPLRAATCSRVLRAWIEDREDGSLVAYRDYKDAFEAGDARAVPYLKMTPEIIEALTKAEILK